MDQNALSQLYHQSTKRFERIIPFDDSKWPEEWKTTYYKAYPRLDKIKLSHKERQFDLFEAIRKRASIRDDWSGTIDRDELSLLLKYACGTTSHLNRFGNWRRAQPSGGARYPIETYGLILKPGKDLPSGCFHYNVKDHQLEMLWQKEITQKDIDALTGYEFVQGACLMIFMTAVFWRTQNKYGERGYRFILQESGHIGQNIYLLCQALNLKCCSLAGFRISEEDIEKIIDVDGITESLVYAIAIGK